MGVYDWVEFDQRFCPKCESPLQEEHCKLRCKECGFTADCTDP